MSIKLESIKALSKNYNRTALIVVMVFLLTTMSPAIYFNVMGEGFDEGEPESEGGGYCHNWRCFMQDDGFYFRFATEYCETHWSEHSLRNKHSVTDDVPDGDWL